MKKFLSLMLALVTVFTCTATVSAEDEAAVITKHPDSSSPSVEVSDPDSVKSYQWYVADGFAEGDITDENAEIIDLKGLLGSEEEIPDGAIEFLRNSNSYDSENGWTPGTIQLSDGDSSEMYFSFYLITYLEAGSTLSVNLRDDNGFLESQPIMLLLFGENDSPAQIELDEDLGGSVYIENEGYYYLFSMTDADPSGVYLEAYGNAPSYAPIEGETESGLSEIALGSGLYRCAITLKDGTVLYSYSFSAFPEILSQPSAADPTVEVTFEEDASFRWYESDGSLTILDDSYPEYIYGSFDSESGEWTPLMGDPYEFDGYLEYQLELFEVNLIKGQTVNVTISNPAAISPSDPDLRFHGSNGKTEHAEWDENGVATFTPSESGLYEIYQYACYPETATFKIEFIDFSKTELEGETAKTLKNPEIGKYYTVSAFYGDEIELVSDMFLMEYAVSKQPSIDAPSVEVNLPNDVDFYEWYTFVYTTVEVTDDHAKSAYYPGDSIGEPSYYDHENGYWVGSLYSTEIIDGATCYEYDIFEIQLSEGDILTLTPSAEIDDNTIYTNNNSDSYYEGLNDIWTFEDGTFTFVAPETAYYSFYIYTFTEDITFEATLTIPARSNEPIEGEDGPELNTSEPGFYVCFVTFKDGTVIASDMLIVTKDEFGILGDVNDDGVINQYDYILVKRHHFETRTLTEDEIPRADVNKDGTVNQYDYLLIARHYFGTYVIE